MSKKPAAALLSAFLSVLGCSGKDSGLAPEQAFWQWFQKNQEDLFDFEKDREKIFDRLTAEMHRVESHLTFEFGPKQNGRREFTISADGIREAFPAVERLYAAAPPLPRWKVQKFRQRQEVSEISFKGVYIKSSTVSASLAKAGEKADIEVFIPGYSESARETYLGIAFLFLDQALGEYDVETRVGGISVKDASQAPPNAFPLRDLANRFDALK